MVSQQAFYWTKEASKPALTYLDTSRFVSPDTALKFQISILKLQIPI
jgi:hypothetical protein